MLIRPSQGCMINLADLVVELQLVVHLATPTVYFVAGSGWATAAHEVSHHMTHATHSPQNKLLESGTLQIS